MSSNTLNRRFTLAFAVVALCLALDTIRKRGLLETMPVRDYLAAISAGVVDGEIMLDLRVEFSLLGDDRNVGTGNNPIVVPTFLTREVVGTLER